MVLGTPLSWTKSPPKTVNKYKTLLLSSAHSEAPGKRKWLCDGQSHGRRQSIALEKTGPAFPQQHL